MKKLKFVGLLLIVPFLPCSLNAGTLLLGAPLGLIGTLTKAYPQTMGVIKSTIVFGALKIAGAGALIAAYPTYPCKIAKKFLERFDKNSLVADNKYFSISVDKNFLQTSKVVAAVSLAAVTVGAGSYILYKRFSKERQKVTA